MDIVMITRDRPELTIQTIESLRDNSEDWSRHRLLVVFDGSEEEAHQFGKGVSHGLGQVFVAWTGKQLGVGGAKNFGAEWCLERLTTPHDLLMFTDNDMYYLPGWDQQLENGLRSGDTQQPHVVQLGGWRHPFHKPGRQLISVGIGGIGAGSGYTISAHEVDAATGNCFCIRWSDWLLYGPFDSNALGPGQSEDFALSQKIKAAGGLVATLDPPVAIHCGITNSEGKVATGWAEMLELAMCQVHEYGLLDKVSLTVPDAVKSGGADHQQRVEDHKQRAPEPDWEALHRAGKCSCKGGLSSEPCPWAQRMWLDPPVPQRVAAQNIAFRQPYGMPLRINCGSGQRRFDPGFGWVNVDIQSHPPDRVPDVQIDASTQLVTTFGKETADIVVLHHVLEHFGCGEANGLLQQCWEVLKSEGRLLVFVPDVAKLAGRWLGGELEDQIFLTSIYGAYMGSEDDRHKFGYTAHSLQRYLADVLPPGPKTIQPFDWRAIPGADIARDFWIAGIEVIKS